MADDNKLQSNVGLNESVASAAHVASLSCTIVPRISVAFYQNSVPIVGEISLDNRLGRDLENISITISTEPSFVTPMVWRIDRIRNEATHNLQAVDVNLDPAALLKLNDRVKARVTVVARALDEEIARCTVDVDLLPPSQWMGAGSAPELLAAFVKPNDPSVDAILRIAAEKLKQSGRDPTIDGYKTGKKARAWELAEAIWAALASEGLAYSLPPASFERDGQKVRGPSEILQNKIATCLDISLFFAACLEQAGLNSIVVLTKGHAFSGLWLKEEDFSAPIVDDPLFLRKRVDLDEIVLVETTFLTGPTPSRFRQAADKGRTLVAENVAESFELALDVRRARRRQIRPLSLGNDPTRSAIDVNDQVSRGATEIEGPPPLVEEGGQEKKAVDDATVDRLERWKRRLLDLSLRNKLLNYSSKSRAITLECTEPALLQERLAEGAKFKILGRGYMLKSNSPINLTVFENRHKDDAWKIYAHDALGRGEIHVDLVDEELNNRLTDLYRTTRTAFEEGGSNILFLSLGFLKWVPAGRDVAYRAPLLLIPVALERRSISGGFRLVLHEDEARLNPTLMEMLRQDFLLFMPELEGDLPENKTGLDVARIWRIVQTHVKDLKGWEMTPETVLSTFSFNKFLMWKDLVDRMDQLKRSRLVRHLVDTPTAEYQDGMAFVSPYEIDSIDDLSQVFTPLPADSSQMSAVMTAARGRDFTLFGPPGTGKSQTIANIIAQTLAIGKTVLFVSQKTAALEVVQRRLSDFGLGDYCLEVHSAKAQKSSVLAQLDSAWRNQPPPSDIEWATQTANLRTLRDELNALVSALSRRRTNKMTAYDALGRVVADRDRLPNLSFNWPDIDAHTDVTVSNFQAICRALRTAVEAVGSISGHPLQGIDRHEWSPLWQAELLKTIEAIHSALPPTVQSAEAFDRSIGIRLPMDGYTSMKVMLILGRHLLDPRAVHGWHFLTERNPEIQRAIASLKTLTKRAAEVRAALACTYRKDVLELDFDGMIAEWKQATESNFLLRSGRQDKIRQKLSHYTMGTVPQDCGRELATIRSLAALNRSANTLEPILGVFDSIWAWLDTKVEAFSPYLDWAERLKSGLSHFQQSGLEPSGLCSHTVKLLSKFGHLFSASGDARFKYETFESHWSILDETLKHAARVVGARDERLGLSEGPGWVSAVMETTTAWKANLHHLPVWCAWRRVATDATAKGLGSLVEAVETGKIKPADILAVFDYSYAHWWIERVVTTDPILRNFVAHIHEDRIKQFVTADERVAELSKLIIRGRLRGDIPLPTAFGTDPEWGTLAREIAKKARQMPIRQLFSKISNVLTRLTPCVMMSPLSIAQFLPADAKPFDLVIFDEASQIPVWDAIGVMARGQQCIIVGDPEQLPPTNVGVRGIDDADDETIEDLDSILDECIACNVPRLKLNWHYRSRHESLIAFSNQRYYKGELITFPSPVTEDRAVRFVHVADGVYERGTGRVNRVEAQALVAEVVRRLLDPEFARLKRSIGVVTFNAEQQRLIENMLDQERRNDPRLDAFFDPQHWFEPVFVKNLENVQGDERDVIFFSVAVGPDASGRVTIQISSLNKDGGHRRLNVAITRARRELTVFSTLLPDQIDLTKTKSVGVRDFKHFLEYARRGPRAMAEAFAPTGHDVESPFEDAVMKALQAKGWDVHPQIGVSGFRVDLGIVHPDAAGLYLAGVECDGATYHRAATARDRDRLRELVLWDLGWRIRRVWSTDWWINPVGGIEKLHDQLMIDLREDRAATAKAQKAAEEAKKAATNGRPVSNTTQTKVDDKITEPNDLVFTKPEIATPPIAAPLPSQAEAPARALYADGSGALPVRPVYQIADISASGEILDPGSFYEITYRPRLRRIVAYVIQVEGPIFLDVLIKRIAASHGFSRAAGRIQDTVYAAVESRFPRTTEKLRRVVWPEGADKHALVPFRYSDHRDYDDVPLVELATLAEGFLRTASDSEEVLRMMGDVFNKKLTAQRRERFDQAIALIRRNTTA